MTIVRTLLVWLLGMSLTVLVFLAVSLIRVFDSKRAIIHSVGAVWSRCLIGLAGIKVDLRGGENIPKDTPVIFLSNHQGAFDIPALQGYMPVRFRWVAKKSLFKVPFLGWSMRLAGYIPIDRDNPVEAMKSMEEASEKIRAGASVLIFPEGTRSTTGALLPFKRGAFMLARKSGAPIVPVAIKGTFEIMKRGSHIIRPSKVSISIGKPIPVGSSDEKELRNMTKKAVEALYNDMRSSA